MEHIYGDFGLYENANGTIYCNVCSGETGIPFTQILPKSMYGENFANAPIAAYCNSLCFWLASDEQWLDIHKEFLKRKQPSAINKQVYSIPKLPNFDTRDYKDFTLHQIFDGVENFKAPKLDLTELRVIKPNGNVDYDLLHGLCRTVSPHWKLKPACGLIPALIEAGFEINSIHTYVEFYSRNAERISGLDRAFRWLFIPPRTKIADFKPTQLNYVLKWLRDPNISTKPEQLAPGLVISLNAETELNYTVYKTGLFELGIFNELGQLDETITKIAAKFIWADLSQKPDFETLKAHLASFVAKRPKAKLSKPAKPKSSKATTAKNLTQKQKKKKRNKKKKRR